jgi:hypothetical protein
MFTQRLRNSLFFTGRTEDTSRRVEELDGKIRGRMDVLLPTGRLQSCVY